MEGLIGCSEVMVELHETVRRVASSQATVLICGPSGTGKEMVARAIHALSPMAERDLVTVDCTSIPANLMESELFGHERGAFTDAKSQKLGLLETAEGSTVFLDEIGLMPLELQAKLLHVLETHRFRRLGGNAEVGLNIRVLAATNEDLETAVKEGRFREDLYYRLNVLPIDLPALSDRGDDVILIAAHCLREFAGLHGTGGRQLKDNTSALLRRYSWPGNVRELRNVIERAVLMTDGEFVRAEDLAIDRRSRRIAKPTPDGLMIQIGEEVFLTFPYQDLGLDQIERAVIEGVLRDTGGNVTKAATLLKVSRDTLRYRIGKHKIVV